MFNDFDLRVCCSYNYAWKPGRLSFEFERKINKISEGPRHVVVVVVDDGFSPAGRRHRRGGRRSCDGAGAARRRPQRSPLERQMPPFLTSPHSPGILPSISSSIHSFQFALFGFPLPFSFFNIFSANESLRLQLHVTNISSKY